MFEPVVGGGIAGVGAASIRAMHYRGEGCVHMTANQIAAVGFLVLALVAGGGMLLVRPAPSEPARLNGLFPGARLLQYFWVRVLFAIFIILVGCFGATTAVGWV